MWWLLSRLQAVLISFNSLLMLALSLIPIISSEGPMSTTTDEFGKLMALIVNLQEIFYHLPVLIPQNSHNYSTGVIYLFILISYNFQKTKRFYQWQSKHFCSDLDKNLETKNVQRLADKRKNIPNISHVMPTA